MLIRGLPVRLRTLWNRPRGDRFGSVFLARKSHRGTGVTEYRAYLLGRDGRIQGFEPLSCADDAAAIVAARRLIAPHGVEVWQGARRVVTLKWADDYPIQRIA